MPSLRFGPSVAALLLWPVFVVSQTQSGSPSMWVMQDSGTTAGLRGVDSVDGTLAWASGTGGTILRTTDSGEHWTRCATPDAEKDGAMLDFRGVQAWDAQTAIVMASGPGDKSRLYKTTDGCRTWKLLIKNSDPTGFYDAIVFWDRQHGLLFGDPVRAMPSLVQEKGAVDSEATANFDVPRFLSLMTEDGGNDWGYWIVEHSRPPSPGRSGGAAFAASNSSSFLVRETSFDASGHKYQTVLAWVGTGGNSGSRVFLGSAVAAVTAPSAIEWSGPIKVPMASSYTQSSGIFSIAFRLEQNRNPEIDFTGDRYNHGVVVGGDYTKPTDSTGTAAWSADGGQHWTSTTKPPHGYRSAVQWSEALKLWITVGTNGSDISRDDGRMWQPLDDGNWNALSLPFVVGPGGRIAKLRPAAVPAGPPR